MRLAEHILPVEMTLPHVSIFTGLCQEALKQLAREAHRHEFSAGSMILHEGEPGRHMYLVESGKVRVCKNAGSAREKEIAVLGPGSTFGEGCILTTLPRVASVQALTDTVLFSLSSIAFYHLYQARPDQYSILILNIARDLSRRLRELDEAFAGCH